MPRHSGQPSPERPPQAADAVAGATPLPPQLLEELFDRLPMGLALLNRDLTMRRWNPAWLEAVSHYTPTRPQDIRPGMPFLEIMPGVEGIALPIIERVLAGETVQTKGLRAESGRPGEPRTISYWDLTLSPLIEGGQITGMVMAGADATERVLATQELQRAVETLREREERLALVMRGTNDGLWDWNVQTGEVYYSPRWKAMLGYGEDELVNHIDTWRSLIHPDDLERAMASVEDHFAGYTPLYELLHRLRHKDGSYRWVLARGVAVRDSEGRAIRMGGSHTDVTESRQAQEALHYQVALQDLITTISTQFINLQPDEVDDGIQRALGTIGEFTGVDRSHVFLFSGDRARIDCTHEWCAPGVEPQILHLQNLVAADFAIVREHILRQEAWHVPQVTDLPPGADRSILEEQKIQSVIMVPMVYHSQVIGYLGFDAVRHPTTWPGQTVALLKIVGEIFSNALEHKRARQALQRAYDELETRVAERTAELRQANERLQQEVRRRKHIEEALRKSEAQYRDLVENANSVILQMDIQGRITFFNKYAQAFFGYTEREILGQSVIGTIVPRQDHNGVDLGAKLDDVLEHPEDYPSSENENMRRNGERVWVAWTNRAIYDEQGEISEVLCIGIDRTQQKRAEEALAQQLKQNAIAAERNRLARDLHDAVTQTLFSASLMAEVLPRLWEKDPEEGRRRLRELRELTRGALAEMRTLLLELRPATLVEAEMRTLLTQLAESITGRARIPVKVQIAGTDCGLPPEVKVALYRIVQEALNNVAKHSSATQAEVSLHCEAATANEPWHVVLHIRDNGQGFDPDQTGLSQLGLRIMHERAESIGAQVAVTSAPGEGTEIVVTWQGTGEYRPDSA